MSLFGDAWTIARKETLEVLADRHSAVGVLLPSACLLVLIGGVLPVFSQSIWRSVDAAGVLFMFFPSVIAAQLAADAFAGERERRTIETLLAMPLARLSIFGGKAASAALFGWLLGVMCLASAAAVASAFGSGVVPGWRLLLSIAAGSFGASLVSASVGIAVSSLVPVARSAQQLAIAAAVLVTVLGGQVLEQMRLPLSAATVLKVDAVILLVGACALGVTAAGFRRERFL